jgi:excisionase family DNA binding protein
MLHINRPQTERLHSVETPPPERQDRRGREGMTEPRLAYRLDELAVALGVSRRTLERKIANGELPATKRFGAVLVSASVVNAMLASEAAQPLRRKRVSRSARL